MTDKSRFCKGPLFLLLSRWPGENFNDRFDSTFINASLISKMLQGSSTCLFASVLPCFCSFFALNMSNYQTFDVQQSWTCYRLLPFRLTRKKSRQPLGGSGPTAASLRFQRMDARKVEVEVPGYRHTHLHLSMDIRKYRWLCRYVYTYLQCIRCNMCILSRNEVQEKLLCYEHD